MGTTWYVEHPLFQYNEDVLELAREHGLRIIDALVTDDRSDECEDPPRLTKVGDPAAEPEAPKADSAAEQVGQPAIDAPKRRGRPAKAGG